MELEQLRRGEPAREAEELGEVAGRPPRLDAPGRRPGDRDLAAARLHQAAGDLRERRLAGAVRAEQPDQLALADEQVHAAQRLLAASVGLRQPTDRECGSHARAQASILSSLGNRGSILETDCPPPREPNAQSSTES